ncbi:MAG TPA: Gfo/Idh/MocA family oxidoreductase [Armatimonadaceae bacterium]|nr:Gfo/Idh/MocA family oxidoreductase [Armatimonadaceae bacterium]
MTNRIQVGIIGAGHMGTRHAACWNRLPGAALVAVADVVREKAERLAGGNAAVYDSAEALLTDPNVQAVSICVPTHLHRTVAEAAAKAGKHILCEKPMALTSEDCAAMTEAARAAGVVLTVGHVVRFFPEYANAKRLVESGAVGKPAAVRTRRGGGFPRPESDWYGDVSRSGGVILDLMVHDLDWLQWCFGPIKRVYAQGLTERLADGSLDHMDYALLTLRHESGVISHVEGTWSDPAGFATTFEIAGDGGLLSHDSRQARSLQVSLRGVETKQESVVTPSSPLAEGDEPYFREIAAFAKSVTEGAPPAVTPEEASSAVAVAVAARESLRTGDAVEIG